MQIGNLFILAGLLASLFSAWNYYSYWKSENASAHRKKSPRPQEKYLQRARVAFYLLTAAVAAASAILLSHILSHNFQLAYVYQYSSRDLPLGYLISTFWAGQEGSFLLWTLLTALMGIVLIRQAGIFESLAMLVINLVQAFFLIILVKASPFALLPQLPPDGAGLNPLLQNPWMVIHPPVLFAGYAAAAFPFALAIAALVRRQFQSYLSAALPWVLFTSLTLGAGIIIGGYWAYKVLGWGGYWGWDPVENSSLIPWLTTMALFHGLVVQKLKGALMRTNFLLAIVTLPLVLYATFLTRSGVLADFSVHSFTDLGITAYLVVFLMVALLGGVWILASHFTEISSTPLDFSELNKENFIFGSLLVFVASAVFTFLGTSSPLLTGLLGNPAQVDIAYYNTVHLPIGIALSLLLGFAPFLRWRSGNAGLLTRLLPSVLLALISLGVLYWAGMRSPLLLAFGTAATFALVSNAVTVVRVARQSWWFTGAPLTHAGVALLLLGILISGVFEQTQRINLIQGTEQSVMGYQLRYEQILPQANGKDIVKIAVKSANDQFTAMPRLYQSNYTNGLMREPAVRSHVFYDLYLSPLQITTSGTPAAGAGNQLLLRKGETKVIGDLQVHFAEFDLSRHAEAVSMWVGTKLQISRGSQTFTVTPAVLFEKDKKTLEAAEIPGSSADESQKISITLTGLDANTGTIELTFAGLSGAISGAPAEQQLLVEISTKPFMNVLWLGTILITLGTVIALLHRRRENSQVVHIEKEKAHVRRQSVPEMPN